MRKFKSENAPVVDVKGSHMYKKQTVAGVTVVDTSTLPELPLIGWVEVDGPNSDAAKQIPMVTHGMSILLIS